MDRQRCGNRTNRRGFAVLFSVIVLGAIGATISIALLTQAIQFERDTVLSAQSTKAQSLANACAEYALNALRADQNYAGNETVSIGDASCVILALDGSGNTKTIKTTSTVGTATRKVRITTSQTTPNIILSQWREVADF